LRKIGNRLVVGRQPPQQPDHLEIAPCLALQTTARLDAVEIAVYVELQQPGRVVGGPARRFRHHAIEAELPEVQRVDERINRADRIALVDKVIEAFGQQRPLPPIRPFNEPLHRLPPQIARRIISATAFLRSQGHKRYRPIVCYGGEAVHHAHASGALSA
jgi:hypothetical protein